ncbi:MAG: DUF6522 family protein [Steroidobacteraceae bacterium]
MSAVVFEQGAISIDATVIAVGLEIDPTSVHALMREKKITSLCEHGIGQDAGHYRLTFFHENRRLLLMTDPAGHIIKRSVTDRDEGETP